MSLIEINFVGSRTIGGFMVMGIASNFGSLARLILAELLGEKPELLMESENQPR